MLSLNKIEAKYLKLLRNQISIKDFEKWVYNSNWLKNELTEEEYTDLVSLNYNTSAAKYEIGIIIKDRYSEAKFETVKLIELLDSIIERDNKEAEALIKLYDLYGRGFYFLNDLGLGIGLNVELPSNYGVEYYHELNEKQKKEVVNRFYPAAKDLAIELKNWLLNEDLILIKAKESGRHQWDCIDNRTDKDKVSRVWVPADIDEKTGKIRSLLNILLDKMLRRK